MNLKDRVAVISGAGGGIGRATALSLARRGCHVALADIDEAGLDATQAQALKLGVRASKHRLDVADRAAVAALPAQTLTSHGRVDLLINNAGVALGGRFDEVGEADFDWLMEINFHAVVRMTRAFLPALRSSDDARIVIRMHLRKPALACQLFDARLRLADRFAVQHHLGAMRARRRHLHDGRGHRHDDGGRDVQPRRVIGDRLGMVAGRHGDDAARLLGCAERSELHQRAAVLERIGDLQVLVFDVDLGAGEA